MKDKKEIGELEMKFVPGGGFEVRTETLILYKNDLPGAEKRIDILTARRQITIKSIKIPPKWK